MNDDDKLLTTAECAAIFRVDPKTVSRWALAGKLPPVKTPGGHNRFRQSDVRALLAGTPVLRAVRVA